MVDFDNIFDAAMSRADNSIITTMGIPIHITSGRMSNTVVHGVFDDPESISYPINGIRIEGTSPTIFIESLKVTQLERVDTLVVNGSQYWVDRIGPDDCGSCHIFLGRGSPPTGSRRR